MFVDAWCEGAKTSSNVSYKKLLIELNLTNMTNFLKSMLTLATKISPFLAGAALGGYGVLGLYASTRKPLTDVTKADIGWFTANVLENKIFNYFIAAAFVSAYITSGLVDALLTKDINELVSGYLDLFSKTAIASASSMDLLILTTAGASFVSEDVKRRNVDNEITANLIGASTMLLPGVGLALYCAFRPSLNEE